MTLQTVSEPISPSDPINARILAISEDRIQGFLEDPISAIAEQADLPVDTVVQRIRAMLRGGTVRRVRQTLMATNLASGALVAWQVPEEKLDAAFDFMFREDPFSGHVVIRSTDAATPGSRYRLWTTVKTPQGYSISRHCELLAGWTGAERFRVMPAHRIFALGVGHVRRRGMEIGSRSEALAEARSVEVVQLNDLEWRVLTALKEELQPEEIGTRIWVERAERAEVPYETFLAVAHALDQKRVIGRFSTFLEHVKELATGERITRYNALFHWAVPRGRELEAGCEIGRHHVLTHCYWREGGPEFHNVNIMAVAHGTEKPVVLAHKAAMDAHLEALGIPVDYTNVFWGGRSEIKPSEISPFAYRAWCSQRGVDSESLRESTAEPARAQQ